MYGKAKSVRAKTRFDEMQCAIDNMHHMQSVGGADITKLLIFFQHDSERRAEVDAIVTEKKERSEKSMKDENYKVE
ncbi:hypothetical protein PHMEG_00012843 [Phytophthora megakarya]|uniref:Uncharacterized protein n=1 Tax=Phytophthora megakarya TaxID=4795 RepID=A0A225W9V7_9STRA|nr:hypothetical protein PHMEG_00012843 [Phytophthora megakarya]